MSSNSASIFLFFSEKSMRIYDLYSFFANYSTKVDFPTRLAPFINNAVEPLRCCFHSSILSYNFLLNIMIRYFFDLQRKCTFFFHFLKMFSPKIRNILKMFSPKSVIFSKFFV